MNRGISVYLRKKGNRIFVRYTRFSHLGVECPWGWKEKEVRKKRKEPLGTRGPRDIRFHLAYTPRYIEFRNVLRATGIAWQSALYESWRFEFTIRWEKITKRFVSHAELGGRKGHSKRHFAFNRELRRAHFPSFHGEYWLIVIREKKKGLRKFLFQVRLGGIWPNLLFELEKSKKFGSFLNGKNYISSRSHRKKKNLWPHTNVNSTGTFNKNYNAKDWVGIKEQEKMRQRAKGLFEFRAVLNDGANILCSDSIACANAQIEKYREWERARKYKVSNLYVV